jgi:hypothetical protein
MKIRWPRLQPSLPARFLFTLIGSGGFCLAALSAPAAAQEFAQTSPTDMLVTPGSDAWQRDAFAFTIGPIPVGALDVASRENGTAYEARMTLRTTGLAGLVRRIAFEGETSGLVVPGEGRGTRFRPLVHRQRADTGRHASRTVIDFSGGRPQVTEAVVLPATTAVAEHDRSLADDAARGSIDPLTLVLSVLRSGTDTPICGTTALVFDGLRVTRADIGLPDHPVGRIRCTGTYTRLAGFSPAEMAERRSFAFVLTFGVGHDGRPRLDLVEMDTLYGKGRLKRR